MRIDARYEVYERKVYNLLELLEETGGLKEALHVMGHLMVGFFCTRMFHMKIMHRLY